MLRDAIDKVKAWTHSSGIESPPHAKVLIDSYDRQCALALIRLAFECEDLQRIDTLLGNFRGLKDRPKPSYKDLDACRKAWQVAWRKHDTPWRSAFQIGLVDQILGTDAGWVAKRR